MNLSSGEIEALARLAGRGAGLPWGIADEAGRAVRWLEGYGWPGAQIWADDLRLTDASSWDARRLRLEPSAQEDGAQQAICPISFGTALADHSFRLEQGEVLRGLSVGSPLLCVPFAAQAALQWRLRIKVEWRGAEIWIAPNRSAREADPATRIVIDGDEADFRSAGSRDILCFALQGEAEWPKGEERPFSLRARKVDPTSHAILEGFAARTFAPATAESRRLGAGADA